MKYEHEKLVLVIRRTLAPMRPFLNTALISNVYFIADFNPVICTEFSFPGTDILFKGSILVL